MADLHTLVEQIEKLAGLDYGGYDPFVLDSRIARHLAREGHANLGELEARIGADGAALDRLLLALTPEPSLMFSEARFWLAVRQKVVPHLRTYPRIRVWVPGCGEGAMAYALAIVLREEGLYERARIYATDIAEVVLARAREGALPAASANGIRGRYLDGGGKADFHEYWDGVGKLRPLLRDRIVFAQHNLATDASFNEFHLIVCEDGVLSDFRPSLELRLHHLLADSVCRFGILALPESHGLPEGVASFYEPFDDELGFFRRGIG